MVFVLLVPVPVTSMAPMEQMHERTNQEYQIGQRAEQMRAMLGPEKKSRNSGES